MCTSTTVLITKRLHLNRYRERKITAMASELDEFEDFLDPEFKEKEFANNLLKSTNSDLKTNILDLDTPIKKLNYDVTEVDKRINQLINENPSTILNELYKGNSQRETINTGLKPSLQYLDLSYKRLQEEILTPYESAQKLQVVLSKIHQTSNLLRDSLIYIHLVTKIQSFSEPDNNNSNLNLESLLQLSSLYSQAQLTLDQNINLKSLQLTKELENNVIKLKKKELLNTLSLSLSKECLNSIKLRKNKDEIMTLAKALYVLSPEELCATIHRVILSSVTTNSQVMIRNINSIKNFPNIFPEIVKKGHDIYLLETILKQVKVDNTNLLLEYCSQRKNKFTTPRKLFWSRLSSNFKKEFDISYNRGGPVGMTLMKSRDLIINTYKDNMPHSSDENDFEENLAVMLNSISILK